MTETTTKTPLTMSVPREVKPSEVVGLIFGSGGLSWEWWKGAEVFSQNTELPGKPRVTYGYDEKETIDDWYTSGVKISISSYDGENDGGHKVTELTFPQVIAAAERALRGDGAFIDEESARDMRTEDLGYADAIAADAVLQLAVFGQLVYG